MRKFTILLILMLFFGLEATFAQRTITGKVTSSEDSTGIPGTTVLVKGTSIGAITDLDGNYSLTVPRDKNVILISFVGMTTIERTLGEGSVYNFVMYPNVKELEGIVITALGIPREKKSLGYSVQGVTGEEITRTANPNFETGISGKFAGVEVRQSSGMPGSPSEVMIRGARSFSGDNTPLYVVDGMPISSAPDYQQNVTGTYYSNRALDIDPNNIESVEVLKGQAAGALYGLRASNGVILITTKKGKLGEGGKSVSVSLNSNFTSDIVARLPERQSTYAQGYYDSDTVSTFYPAFSYSWGPKITDLPKDPTYGGDNYEGHAGQFFDPYKGQWVIPQAYNSPKNFYNKNGQTWNNNINIAGLTNTGNYNIGFSTINQKGIISETGMDRYNGSASGAFKLGSQWKTGFSANFSSVNLKKLPSGNSSWLFTVYGSPPSFDLMGTPYHENGTNGDYRQISYRRGAVGENPNWALVNNHFYEKTDRFFGNIFLEYSPMDWLKIRYQLGVDAYGTQNEDLWQMGSTNNGQALPKQSQYPDPEHPDRYTYIEPTGGQLNLYGINRTIVNSLLNLTFTKRWKDTYGLMFVVGNEYNDNRSKYWNMNGTGFTTPGWNNMSNATTQTGSNSQYWDRSIGTFGNLLLDWKSIVFLGATGRYDRVSSMPKGNRDFFYPSVSASFVFTGLNPLKDNKVLSFGKIRISYAEVGQAGNYLNNYYVLGGATSGFLSDGIVYPLGGISGYQPSTIIYDPNLKPQNTNTIEPGFELKFFQNRIGLDYTYSYQTAKNQIFGIPLAGSTGYATYYTNAGKMISKTHEIVLTAIPVKSKSFTWDLLLNFTKTINTCEELAPGVESIFLGGYETPNIRASAGDAYPAIYGNMFARDDQGRILVDEDPTSEYYGMPYQGKFGKIGEVTPKFMIGFNNNFTFFNMFTLTARIDWKNGGQMYSGSNRLMDLYGTSKRTEDRTTPFIYDGYKKDGTKNDIQRGGSQDQMAYADLYNDIYGNIEEAAIYETSFVKLREILIAYTFPKKIVKALHIQDLSLNIFARNILIWTSLPNFDPEASQGQGNMQGGMDYMSLPQTTSIGGGFNITF